jgi:hypothetical protein
MGLAFFWHQRFGSNGCTLISVGSAVIPSVGKPLTNLSQTGRQLGYIFPCGRYLRLVIPGLARLLLFYDHNGFQFTSTTGAL